MARGQYTQGEFGVQPRAAREKQRTGAPASGFPLHRRLENRRQDLLPVPARFGQALAQADERTYGAKAATGPRGDEHLFALLDAEPDALLVSGDAQGLRHAGSQSRTPAALDSKFRRERG